MNIDELYTLERHDAGEEMQVKTEQGEPLEVWLTLVGIDSKIYRNITNELQSSILKNLDADKELLKAQSMAKCTIGWRGMLENGKEIEFDRERVEQLYLNAPYIYEQANDFIVNRLNFTKG